LGKSVHLNRPGKKHNSGFGLPRITVTKINNKRNICDGNNTASTRLDGANTAALKEHKHRYVAIARSKRMDVANTAAEQK